MSDALYLETREEINEAFEELGFNATLKKTDTSGTVSDYSIVLVRGGEPERKNEMNIPVGDVEYIMKENSVVPKRTDVIEFSDGEKEIIMRAVPIKPGNIVIAWELVTSFK